jgi:hypothetical protein
MTAEIRLAPGGWPTCRWSWPTFWAFTSIQFTGSMYNDTRWFAGEALENDGFDGFPLDNSTQVCMCDEMSAREASKRKERE